MLVGESVVFGTVMSARKSALTLPLPLQFLAAWLAVWLGRVLQEQVEYLKAENLVLREVGRLTGDSTVGASLASGW